MEAEKEMKKDDQIRSAASSSKKKKGRKEKKNRREGIGEEIGSRENTNRVSKLPEFGVKSICTSSETIFEGKRLTQTTGGK